MLTAHAFLDTFRLNRDFSVALPLMERDSNFREALIRTMESGEYPYADHASWIAQRFFEQHPGIFMEWIPLVKRLVMFSGNHTIQRNMVHVFTRTPAAVEEDGELLDRLIFMIRSNDSLPALKVLAFRAVELQYLKAYPELLSELKALIEVLNEDGRPSIRSLVRNFKKRYPNTVSR